MEIENIQNRREETIRKMKLMKLKKVRQSGYGVGDSIYFEAYSQEEITRDDAIAAQNKMDYSSIGYGFKGFKCEKLGERKYKATWSCWASCE